MYIIAGLGNPGRKYENTRHNTGFAVIDVIAKKNGISILEKKHKAMLGMGYIEGRKVLLVKPQTFMNLSGESLRELIDYYKVDEKAELIVIYDDTSMEVGQLRIRKKGSAGGHNGLKSIISLLGHDSFLRIKVGIGEKPAGYDLANYVLGHFTEAEAKRIEESALLANEAVCLMIQDKTDAAMNLYNKKQEVEP